MQMHVLGEYRSDYNPTWCPGCGDYGVLKSMDIAFHELGLRHEDIVVVSGIGCNGRVPHNFRTWLSHPSWASLADRAGHQDCETRALRRWRCGRWRRVRYWWRACPTRGSAKPRFDIVFDNGIYGQTKGQPSPTTPLGYRTKITPNGSYEDPLDISQLALVYGVSFLARGFPGKPNHLAHIIAEGIRHKGFALIHILNPCPTFHDTWKEYASKVIEIGPDHNPADYKAAFKSVKRQDKIPIGLIFKQNRPTLEERLKPSTASRLELKQLLANYR